MTGPEAVLGSARERAAEITWWNRRLTKLRTIANVENLQSFLQKDLIEAKGPFVEFVDAPEPDTESARARLSDFGYSDEIIEALEMELFGGTEGTLYQHQRETIEAIETTDDDVMLTVPTATGKTESFFLPLLNACEKSGESGTKAIVIYPMKTLAVDQLNRFISYLYQVNRTKSQNESITIGIWDGDTPQRVGGRKREIESGSYVRGLEDPLSGEKLSIDQDGIVGTEEQEYPWLKTTRDRIKEGAEILLVTPEALDHILVSDSESTRAVLGESDNHHPVEHIVFDEAHVWSGVSGAGIQLLVQRLKHFYRDYDPKVSLVSATVKNPESLAASLTGSNEEDITTVSFSGRTLPTTETPQYGRFEPSSTTQLITALAASQIYETKSHAVDEHPDLGTAIQNLQEVELLDEDDFRIPSDEDWLEQAIYSALTDAMDRTELSEPADIVRSEEGRSELTEQILEKDSAESEWLDIIQERIPEVATLRSWAKGATVGAVGFRKLSEIRDYLAGETEKDTEPPLQTFFAFGKLAGVITDRHHAFLKPPRAVFFCEACGWLSTSDVCPQCGLEDLPEIQFCDDCHYPYLLQTHDGVTEHTTINGTETVEYCTDCDEKLQTSDIGVPTSSLLSYMLSEICRETSSEKVLVFSDSHSAAESVAQRIQNTEYGLTAESLYIEELLEYDGVAAYDEVLESVQETLTQAYFRPFLHDHLDQRGPAYSMIQQLHNQITKQANLYSTNHLLSEALVTSDIVFQNADSTLELIVGHELYKRFASRENVSFQESKIEFNFLTVDKIRDRVTNQIPKCERDIDSIINDFVVILHEQGVIQEKDFHSIRQRLDKYADSDETFDALFEHFIQAGDEFAELADLGGAKLNSGVFHREHNKDSTNLRLVPTIARCRICRATFPILNTTPPEQCYKCGNEVEHYQRFTVDNNGSYSGTGIAEIDAESEWNLDHWASDIMNPITTQRDPRFVTVGIHKSNIPPTLRGIIEDGFRQTPPEINVVSSTPTMELGVDIGNLDTVAQVGIPPTLTNYVQRSGRTGRSQGSSSLVMTAIRGRHPIDNHYYDDLSRFFEEFERVRVPPATEFDPIVASHVVTEVFGFLARTQDQHNTFDRNFKITQRDLTASEFIENVESNIESLQSLIVGEWRNRITDRIEAIFGQSGLQAFSEVFEEEGSLNLLHRISQSYAPLANSEHGGSAEHLRQNDNRLNIWLDRVGYLASYRNFGHSFPIEIEGYQNDVSFESSGRLYEKFPGPSNGRGAVFRLGGQHYIIDDVSAGAELTRVRLCTNNECDQRFEAYPESQNACPHCGTALEVAPIHEIGSMHARKAGQQEARWTTRGVQTTYTTRQNAPDSHTESKEFIGRFCEVAVDEFEVTRFVYAYERTHPSSNDPKLLVAEAVHSEENTVGEEHVTIGQQYKTSGIQLRFEQPDIVDGTEVDASWATLTASLEQALKRAIAIEGSFDLSDFQVRANIEQEHLAITISDQQLGGGGVTWQLGSEITSILEETLLNIVHCDNCTHYCERCLLLPRTPAFYLDHDLLDRQVLKQFLDTGSVDQKT